MVPFRISFGGEDLEPETKALIIKFELFMRFIFAIDVVLGFRKTYVSGRSRKEIKDGYMIAKQYLKFYFWIDIFAAIPYDLITNKPLAFWRSLSLFKVLRFLRLKRIVSFLNLSNSARVKIRLVYYISSLLIIIHCVACLFHVIVHQGRLNALEESPNLIFIDDD
jgi:hypothetical protein